MLMTDMEFQHLLVTGMYSWEWIIIQNPTDDIQQHPIEITLPSSPIPEVSLQYLILSNPTLRT